MTKKIDAGKMRIILEWGANPADLDSHFIGYSAIEKSEDYHDGYDHNGYEEIIHIYYNEKESVVNGDKKICLDIDDRDGYGPETITVYNFDLDKYCYYIYQYSSIGNLADSDAMVYVYLNNSGWENLEYVFTVPNKGAGKYWNVFACYCNDEDGTLIIEPINTLSEFKPLG